MKLSRTRPEMLGSTGSSMRVAGSKGKTQLHLDVIGMLGEKRSISFRLLLQMIRESLGGNPGWKPEWNYRSISEGGVYDPMKFEGRFLKMLRCDSFLFDLAIECRQFPDILSQHLSFANPSYRNFPERFRQYNTIWQEKHG